MQLKITITINPNGISSVKTETIGAIGAACLWATRKLVQKNPGAILTETNEYYQEEPLDDAEISLAQ